MEYVENDIILQLTEMYRICGTELIKCEHIISAHMGKRDPETF